MSANKTLEEVRILLGRVLKQLQEGSLNSTNPATILGILAGAQAVIRSKPVDANMVSM